MAPPPRTPTQRLPLQASDLLLVLIFSLGGARLFGLMFVEVGFEPLRGRGEAAIISTVLLLLGLQTATLVASVYLVAVRWNGVSWADLGLRPIARGWLTRAFWIAVLILPLVAGVNALVRRLFGELPINPQLDVVAPVGFSWFGVIGMLIMVGALAPFAEELVFRGLFYRWMRERWGVPLAVLASSLAFSLLHGIPWLIPAIALLGAVLALVYEFSGSLWPAVVTHGIYNAVTTALLYLALAHGLPVT